MLRPTAGSNADPLADAVTDTLAHSESQSVSIANTDADANAHSAAKGHAARRGGRDQLRR